MAQLGESSSEINGAVEKSLSVFSQEVSNTS